MNIIETKINGLLILEPRVFGDDRGWFMESFNQKTLSRRLLSVI
jgi:dTDP-4-dehydrorhamnose 3,5-epimerase